MTPRRISLIDVFISWNVLYELVGRLRIAKFIISFQLKMKLSICACLVSSRLKSHQAKALQITEDGEMVTKVVWSCFKELRNWYMWFPADSHIISIDISPNSVTSRWLDMIQNVNHIDMFITGVCYQFNLHIKLKCSTSRRNDNKANPLCACSSSA